MDDPVPRPLPAASEIEQALLAAILYDNGAYDAVADILKPEHFSVEFLGRIYEAAAKLIERGERASVLSLRATFEHDEPLLGVSGPQYMAALYEDGDWRVNQAGSYGRTILDRFRRREAILGFRDTIKDLHECDLDRSAETIIEETQGALDALLSAGETGGLELLETRVEGALEQIQEAYKAQGTGAAGLSTGLTRLDRLIGGLKAGKVYVLAGATAMGKTSCAEGIAYTAARAGKRVAFFSLEMTTEDIIQREISHITGIDSTKINNGWLSEAEMDQAIGTRAEIAALPFRIDDNSTISVAGIRTRARRMMRAGGLDLVVIDYLQLMGSDQRARGMQRYEEIGQMTRGIKTGIAKDLRVPVILLSQLSRQVDSRDDHRPHLSDLRESGSIEQDADVVIFLYRAIYYLKQETPQRRVGETTEKFDAREHHHQELVSRAIGKAEIIVGKQRNGPTGSVQVEFDGPRMRFHEDEPVAVNQEEIEF